MLQENKRHDTLQPPPPPPLLQGFSVQLILTALMAAPAWLTPYGIASPSIRSFLCDLAPSL